MKGEGFIFYDTFNTENVHQFIKRWLSPSSGRRRQSKQSSYEKVKQTTAGALVGC